MNDQAVEQQIQAKGLTAPRVTPIQIQAMMDTLVTQTHVFPGTTSTVAIASLPIGDSSFVVGVGHSACASPANFDAEIGASIAVADARAQANKKLWELEGYALKQRLHDSTEG